MWNVAASAWVSGAILLGILSLCFSCWSKCEYWQGFLFLDLATGEDWFDWFKGVGHGAWPPNIQQNRDIVNLLDCDKSTQGIGRVCNEQLAELLWPEFSKRRWHGFKYINVLVQQGKLPRYWKWNTPKFFFSAWQYTKHWKRQLGDQRISSLVPYAMAESGGRSPGWPFLPDSIKMTKSFLPRPFFQYAFEYGHRLKERWDLYVVGLQVDLQPWVLHLSVARRSAQTCAGS